ncbi:MAG: mannose-1-phosphate guanylyltransferase/mannose-6-phosphate isomerase [Pseudomonadales bacterium]|nr:mannose-1-phosphate guanylyltransferase/mannose-6-phosphate isomerase [Pseudomonadales bacterium]
MLVPVILAGGVGSRLWPLSREYYPKQFHALFGTDSLLQSTLRRAARVTVERPVIVCNEEHRFLVAEQCRSAGLPWRRIILEAAGRNTAPAIALAALDVCAVAENALLLVLPSDHLITDLDAFAEAVGRAALAASEGGLVTFGIRPTAPETGYGYIRVAGPTSGGPATGGAAPDEPVAPVRQFVEKPDAATAAEYLASGEYLWNSGMFVFGARAFLDELARFEPAMLDHVRRAHAEGAVDLDFFRPGRAFLDSPAKSVDYAVMERTARALVVQAAFDWSDVGSWSAIWQVSARDGDGNHLAGDVIAVDTHDAYVLAQHRLVGTLGVNNLVVVETSDAVLVADRDRVQDVRAIVEQLKSTGRGETQSHREVFRPWGSYEGVQDGERYQVKRIKVKPGERLSLQLHHHRSEHWIVVRGTAEVTRGEETFTLAENESTYIPLGVKHRLANPGKLVLELIEVQVGPYLGEDDIVRFEDQYGR